MRDRTEGRTDSPGDSCPRCGEAAGIQGRRERGSWGVQFADSERVFGVDFLPSVSSQPMVEGHEVLEERADLLPGFVAVSDKEPTALLAARVRARNAVTGNKALRSVVDSKFHNEVGVRAGS